MTDDSAFANLKLNCPKNPRKEEQTVIERVLAKKEEFHYGRLSEKTLSENLEKLQRIRDLNNWHEENQNLPEKSTIVTSAELAEIMELMTEKPEDKNTAVSNAEKVLEKILALPKDVEI